MVKCKDCAHYKPIVGKNGFGDCFGVEVPGNRDPKDSPKCRGEYFKAK
jgi:hypothetical protein